MVEPKKEEKKIYCSECKRKIIRWREKEYKDWSKRTMHKSCWKRKQDRYLLFSPPFGGSYIL